MTVGFSRPVSSRSWDSLRPRATNPARASDGTWSSLSSSFSYFSMYLGMDGWTNGWSRWSSNKSVHTFGWIGWMDGWVGGQAAKAYRRARACVAGAVKRGLNECATAQRPVSQVYLERPFFFQIWIILRVLNQETEYSNLREN